MRKVIVLFSLMLATLANYSQSKGNNSNLKGIVYYSGIKVFKKQKKFEEKDSLGNYKAGASASLYHSIRSRNKPVEFRLLFSNSESLFSMSEELEIGEGRRNPSRSIKKNHVTYIDYTNKKALKHKNFAGTLMLIESSIDTLNWDITSESKMIGQYKCLKAINTMKVVGKTLDVENYSLTAWFCPELPYSYGPEEFCGLPGLILEMNVFNYLYTFKKLDLNPKNEKIKSPRGGKRMNNQQFLGIQKNFDFQSLRKG